MIIGQAIYTANDNVKISERNGIRGNSSFIVELLNATKNYQNTTGE